MTEANDNIPLVEFLDDKDVMGRVAYGLDVGWEQFHASWREFLWLKTLSPEERAVELKKRGIE